jgi:hypothetical protein
MSSSVSGDDDPDDDIVYRIADENPYIQRQGDSVLIMSPTFGDKIRIKNPQCKFGSSKNALKDLKHVEHQIKELSVLPDFGYAEDNYILPHHDSQNKWRMLTGLLGDN